MRLAKTDYHSRLRGGAVFLNLQKKPTWLANKKELPFLTTLLILRLSWYFNNRYFESVKNFHLQMTSQSGFEELAKFRWCQL